MSSGIYKKTRKHKNKTINLPKGIGKFLTITGKIIAFVIIIIYVFAKFFVIFNSSNSLQFSWFTIDEAQGLFWIIMIMLLIVLPIDISIIVKNFFNYKEGVINNFLDKDKNKQ